MKQLLSLFLGMITFISLGQELSKEKLYESKKQLRAGNKAYEKNNYADAAIAYQKSLAENGTYYKGAYNLGNSYFNQKKYKEAIEQFQLANKLAETKQNKAKTSELIGDAFKKQKDLEKALAAYKQALLKNPKNDILRQKFIAAKQEKQKQDQQNKDNKDNKDKKDDKNKDNKDQNKDNKDNKDSDKNKDGDKDNKDNKGDDKKDQNKDKDGDNKDKKDDNKEDQKDQNGDDKDGQNPEGEKEQPAQPKESKLSPQQIQQLLESMSNEEQKTQKKINAQKVQVKTNKNEKDW